MPEHFQGESPAIAEIHWVDVTGGQLYVRSWGDGPLVLFLHGWTLDWRIWLPDGIDGLLMFKNYLTAKSAENAEIFFCGDGATR